jgi:hypothetical protein|tara:strand:+ start:52 stop:501 length:450 start_codon:yes stop_codon:yes gene_type:complete
MAHFAKISDTNQVLSVETIDNEDVKNSEGIETESIGQQYLETHSNWPANMWVQTSYNTLGNQHKLGGTPLRGNYAAIGFEWDSTNNIFWPPKPFASWVKDNTIADWKSPIGDPPTLTEEQQSQNNANTNKWHYAWNESNQSWDLTDGMA